jgi:hypothetical protein
MTELADEVWDDPVHVAYRAFFPALALYAYMSLAWLLESRNLA